MQLTRYRTIDSPIGLITLAGFGECITNLVMENAAHPPASQNEWVRDTEGFPRVVAQLEAYFSGERNERRKVKLPGVPESNADSCVPRPVARTRNSVGVQANTDRTVSLNWRMLENPAAKATSL